jgi:hypothetical protein
LGSVSLPTLLFFLYFVLAILGHLSPLKLYGQCVDIHKITSWDFDWDCIESRDQVGKSWHYELGVMVHACTQEESQEDCKLEALAEKQCESKRTRGK